jgi:MinD-like ATPase involved in chromosome partitioning or flagellar assembly
MENPPTYSSQPNGQIVTFYSYKGGVGRSMALANIAVLLARVGKRVLVVDWDLEAPGLNRYFKSADITAPESEGGLLRLLENAAPNDATIPYREFIRSTNDVEFPRIDILPSGDDSNDYSQKLATFSWTEFFGDRRGAQWLENLRAQWKKDYDFVLIDSRTGITDSGGVCTIQLPDILVFVVGPNHQNLDGCKRIFSSIHHARANLPFDRSKLLILPIVARLDGREESQLSKDWLQRCVNAFQPMFDDWLPKECTPLDVLERTKLPHVPRYSFGEELAVLIERESDPDQLPYYYAAITQIIESNFRGVLDVLGKRLDRTEGAISSDQIAHVYETALALAQKDDVVGWRKLNQQAIAQFSREIIEWQTRRRGNIPAKKDELPAMVLDGLSAAAAIIAIALAGVESQRARFENQIGLIDEILSPPGWERSGYTILTQFPETIVFVFQALLGGLALQTYQPTFAHRLANAEIPDAYSNTAEPLFRQTRITGWPESLNHTCTVAWKFLLDLPEHWKWLNAIFGDRESYKAALGSYYMFLNIIEFLDAVAHRLDLSSPGIRFTVPLNFVALSEANRRKANRYFKEALPFLKTLWEAQSVEVGSSISEKWSQWLALSANWVSEVYHDPFYSRFGPQPLKDLPEQIAKSIRQ